MRGTLKDRIKLWLLRGLMHIVTKYIYPAMQAFSKAMYKI